MIAAEEVVGSSDLGASFLSFVCPSVTEGCMDSEPVLGRGVLNSFPRAKLGRDRLSDCGV